MMRKSNPYLTLSLHAWLCIFVVALLCLFTSNPLLTILSILAVPVFMYLLWIKGEPPVLFFVVFFQWIEVTTSIFQANVMRVPVADLFPRGDVKGAVILALTGLLVEALGMRFALRNLKHFEASQTHQEATQLSMRRLWKGYLISYFASFVLVLLARGPAKELLLGLSRIKWVIFFALIYTVTWRNKNKHYLKLAVAIEIITGLSGYFSKFKYALYVLILALLGAGYRMNLKRSIQLTLAGVLTLFLSVSWMAVRGPYRSFLSQGTNQQSVLVSVDQRFNKLIELFKKIDTRDLQSGFEAMVERLAYIEMFSYVLKTVPDRVPHEGGVIWGAVIKHITMPRIFFPDKPPLPSDSAMARKYTGMRMAGEESGTSISTGYMAEAYVDFGVPGMFGPILLLGLLWGWLYRSLTHFFPVKIFGYGIAITILIDTLNFGSNSAKLVGSVLSTFIVMSIIMKIAVRRAFRYFSLKPTVIS